MSIYKAPNLIISPKRKVYRRGGGYTLSHSPPSPRTHAYTYYSVRKRRLLGREKMLL